MDGENLGDGTLNGGNWAVEFWMVQVWWWKFRWYVAEKWALGN